MAYYDYMDKEALRSLVYEKDKEIESLKEEIRKEIRKKEELRDEISRLKPYEQRAKISYDNWVTNAERYNERS